MLKRSEHEKIPLYACMKYTLAPKETMVKKIVTFISPIDLPATGLPHTAQSRRLHCRDQMACRLPRYVNNEELLLYLKKKPSNQNNYHGLFQEVTA